MDQVARMIQTGQEDLNWFNININRIVSDFNNQFIALKNKEVIDADADLDKLVSRLKNKKLDMSGILLRFVSKVKYVL